MKNLELAYTNFFQKTADFPQFKKKGQRESFRIPQGFEINKQNGRIKLPKLGWMRYRKSQDILGQASNVTVSESCASPFELRRQLEYKTQWQGGLLVRVPPQNTSRKCPACGHVAAENRKSQAKFVCVECAFSAHADFVAAVNIREACQEPTEGIPA